MFNPEAGSHGPPGQPISAPDALKTIAPSTPSGTSVKAKRTKTTVSELEAERLEKEAKEKERAEQKAKKEEERLRKEKEKEEEKVRKEQEKAKKEEEKRARGLEKEKKRQEKEEQNKVKEEEQRKKQRVQYEIHRGWSLGPANCLAVTTPAQCLLCPSKSRKRRFYPLAYPRQSIASKQSSKFHHFYP